MFALECEFKILWFFFFWFSEKSEWQKEKERLEEVKKQLEEQKQTDGIKIQEFNVSLTFEETCL